jgi:hypothetical protein
MRFILISNTRYKLNASKYHLQQMKGIPSSADYYHFSYELDAFLSAARSITSLPGKRSKKYLWYLEKEFGHRPGFQKWYDEKVDEYKEDTSMQFMNDERANAVHFNFQSSRTRAEMIEKSSERVWYFDTDQIMGNKTVIMACDEHIHKLEKIVNEVERL